MAAICGLSRPHRFYQRRYADDVDDPRHIIGEDVQRHFRGDVFQPSHLEVSIAHPGFDGTERVLDSHGP